MRRPHRSIETFDISLMAVVTKAMGAFLVLMLLLMPYYSSSPLGRDEAQDLAKKVQDADAKIKGVLDKLGDKELGKDLSSAREQLGSGQQLINQLKRYVDQLSAQVTRLEERLKTIAADLDQLKNENTRLKGFESENARLAQENEKLKAELTKLQQQIADLQAQIARLSKSTPEQVAELERRIKDLEAEVARLQQENAALKAQVQSLGAALAQAQSRVAQLEQENSALKGQVSSLNRQNAALNSAVTQLQEENTRLKERLAQFEDSVVISGSATGLDCGDVPIVLNVLSTSAKAAADGKSAFNEDDGLGNSSPALKGGMNIASMMLQWGSPAPYYAYLIFRDKEDLPLGPATKNCVAIVQLMVTHKGKLHSAKFSARIDAGAFITPLREITFNQSGVPETGNLTPQASAFLAEQVERARKAPPLARGAPSTTPVPP